MYLCPVVCHKNFTAAWRLEKRSDLAEIWHTFFFGEYLGFFVFQKFWILEPMHESFTETRLNLWGSLETSYWLDLAGIWDLFSFGYILG